MKAVYNGDVNTENWTYGKEYDANPSFIKGFVSINDDFGAEQLIRQGATTFLWK